VGHKQRRGQISVVCGTQATADADAVAVVAAKCSIDKA